MKKFLKIVIALFLICGIIVGISGIVIIRKYQKELPDISNIIEDYSPPIPSVVYDRNGEKDEGEAEKGEKQKQKQRCQFPAGTAAQ